MLSANYYREQARLLLEWAQSRKETDHPEMAKWLETRAQNYLVLADFADAEGLLDDAIDAFNERQMTPRQDEP